MKRAPYLVRSLATLGGLVAVIAIASSASAQRKAPPPCIRFWGEARYAAYAYKHIVHIADTCDAPAECVVSSDVNPEAQTVDVPGHDEVEVVTFLGAPGRVFTPRVTCTMEVRETP